MPLLRYDDYLNTQILLYPGLVFTCIQSIVVMVVDCLLYNWLFEISL